MLRPRLRLSAFADGISPHLDEQIRACRAVGVTHVELRGLGGVDVLDFTPAMRTEIRAKLADAGLGVISIGSPVGNVRIDEDWATHFDRFKAAVDAAGFFGAPLVRAFSYYALPGGRVLDHRHEVLRRFAAKAAYVKDANVVLVHQNEKGTYGERGDACLDLLRSINSPHLRAAFDAANFVQVGDDPMGCWLKLAPYTVHIHVTDATADGQVVPAGQGVGQLAGILGMAYADGYRGFLSLDPHPAAAGQFRGFSGPELFTVAADALKAVCRENHIPLAAGG